VYNLEVHGEHVYRIAMDGVLVHNMCPDVPAGLVQNPMFEQALLPYRNGLFTNAGRALTKRPNIVGASSAQELIRMYGNNVGINDGPAAGQTVPHLHIHLIPRYTGDVPDPRGGVRWIIPGKADYWSHR
jgi:hypothetical protein